MKSVHACAVIGICLIVAACGGGNSTSKSATTTATSSAAVAPPATSSSSPASVASGGVSTSVNANVDACSTLSGGDLASFGVSGPGVSHAQTTPLFKLSLCSWGTPGTGPGLIVQIAIWPSAAAAEKTFASNEATSSYRPVTGLGDNGEAGVTGETTATSTGMQVLFVKGSDLAAVTYQGANAASKAAPLVAVAKKIAGHL